MSLKRRNTIIVYLFTASLFLTALWRFSNEEKLKMSAHDEDRIAEFSLVTGDIFFYGDDIDVFSTVPTFSECILPLKSGNITSEFGYRSDPFKIALSDFHSGIDIATALNSDVRSVADGEVVAAGYDDIGGNYIKILHENGFVSYYGHLSRIDVEIGEEVSVGQIIGLSGESGKVTGPHLHFGLYYENVPVDPDVYLNFETLSCSSER